MPQLSLYLNDGAMKQLRTDVERSKSSISKYISNLIVNRSSTSWPENYWEDIYGCLDDPSFVVPAELDSSLDGTLPAFA